MSSKVRQRRLGSQAMATAEGQADSHRPAAAESQTAGHQSTEGMTRHVDQSPRQRMQRALIQRLVGEEVVPGSVVQRVIEGSEEFNDAVAEAENYFSEVNFTISQADKVRIQDQAAAINTKQLKKMKLIAGLKAWIDEERSVRRAASQAALTTSSATPTAASSIPSSEPTISEPTLSSSSMTFASSSSGPSPYSFGDAESKEAIETSVRPKKEKKKKTTMSLFELHESLPATSVSAWDGPMSSGVMFGENISASSSSSTSSSNEDVKNLAIAGITNYMPSTGHGGMKAVKLNLAQVREVIAAGQAKKTPSGKSKYAILRGEGSGDYSGKWQVKFISFVKSGHSNMTYHLTVSEAVYKALTEVVEGDPK